MSALDREEEPNIMNKDNNNLCLILYNTSKWKWLEKRGGFEDYVDEYFQLLQIMAYPFERFMRNAESLI